MDVDCGQGDMPPTFWIIGMAVRLTRSLRLYTRARLRDVTRWLLQRSVRRGTEDGNRQASALAECRCTAHQRYPEMWPRTVTIDAPGFTLAWHSWASELQTLSTDTSMSLREGSSVPVGLLYTSIPSCCTTTPAFSRSSPAGGSATSAQHVRPSGIRCRRPDDLQRSARRAARPHRQHNFKTTFKDTFFSRAIYTSSALEVET